MKTETPETDQWETYCDELEREIAELRRWTSINGVIDLQRERDEARRQLDELKALLSEEQGAVTISRNGYVQEIERERDEARGQRDRLAEALKNCRDDLEMILLERLPNPSETWCSLCDADAALKALLPENSAQ